MRRWRIWLPLVLFAGIAAVALFGLMRPPQGPVASRLVGKPLPAFTLPATIPGTSGLASARFAEGQPRLLNVFASWCGPCIAEAPQLMALKRAGVPIDAIAIRDRPEDVAAFLARHGNPYANIGRDDASQVQLALGSSGVPETFVIDGRGVIRYQHLGNITPADIAILIAEWEKAR